MALTLEDVIYITRLPIRGIRAEMENTRGQGDDWVREQIRYLLGDDRDHSSTWKSGAGIIDRIFDKISPFGPGARVVVALVVVAASMYYGNIIG
jgi:hypothetical protein|uniref:Uncharacterized protein n=1 Tax=Picea glauca TaxID=3330 RepID=A0A101LVR7_PICGL|nr:hypothetical protein ABT39_MTgene1745 [Picea glauca]QHR88422.1 hypothetical protein Q903MT_gene2435 [Picea sitchensis]